MASGFGVLSPYLSRVHGQGGSIAALLEDQADELSGNMAMHETFVSVTKVGV